MRVVVVRPEELGDAEVGVWRSMQRATATLSNPFLSPEFSLAAARFRPAARVAVLTEAQSIAGFFPFERSRLGGGAPICGWVTPCQGLVHGPDVEWDPGELLRGCGLAAWQFNNLVAGQRPFQRYQYATFPSPVIDLTGGFAHYQEQLRKRSAKFCKELKRKERKLAHDTGELRFAVDTPDPGVLRSLMAWKSEQYRRTGRTDRFRFQWVSELLDALLTTRGNHVNGLLSALYAGDRLVAGQFGLRSGKLFAGWYTAYDPGFAKYTPGLIQTIRLVSALADAGVDMVDMGNGAAAYKETLKTRDCFVTEGIVTHVSGLGAAHRARWLLARRTAHMLDRHPGLYRATRPVRMTLRRYG